MASSCSSPGPSTGSPGGGHGGHVLEKDMEKPSDQKQKAMEVAENDKNGKHK